MIEKLIELLKPYMDKSPCENESGSCEFVKCEECRGRELAEKLIENGVILPPCKVGQTVYFLRHDELCEAKVISMEINLYTNPQLWLSLEYYSPMFGTHQYKSRVDLLLGKLLFFTREEAEAAILYRERKTT